MTQDPIKHPRTIKSFVKRAGRVTTRQQKALDELMPKYGVTLQGPLSFSDIFGNENPVVIEIGFGMGHSLLACAQQNPDLNYIGIEVYTSGVGALLADIEDAELNNLKIISEDAVTVLREHINNQSVHGFQIFFPDPWHKKRHHKRRLIQPEFVNLLVQKLGKQGFLHVATDWENYAEQILEVCNANQSLQNQSTDNTYVDRPASRPVTKYERRGERLGHGVWDLLYLNQAVK